MKSLDRGLRSSGQPKLLAIDLDGTLLDPNGLVRPVVRDAIASVREAGVTVVLATARSPMGAEQVCLELGLTGPQISMSGAMFGSPVTGKVEWSRTLRPDDVRSHLEFARAWGLSPTLCLLDGFAAELTPGASFPNDLPHFVVQSKLRMEPSLDTVAGDAVIRTYFPTGPAIHTTVVRALQARFGATASVVWADNLGVELLSRGTNKGRALATVARSMGIARDQTAAIGDGPNDLEMLRIAGVSAAMRNAPPNVALEATFVVPTSAEDGVLEALRRFYPNLPIPVAAPVPVPVAAPRTVAQPELGVPPLLPATLAETAA